MQYAVDVLKVKHVIVTGHYGCGGVAAALRNQKFGLIDNWLRHVQDVRQKHAAILADLDDEALQIDMLCELNVIEQVVNVSQTTIVQDAWARGQEIDVHGWIYGLADGRLRDLDMVVQRPEELASVHAAAVEACVSRKGEKLKARRPGKP
jgi:carbonic anhydrase